MKSFLLKGGYTYEQKTGIFIAGHLAYRYRFTKIYIYSRSVSWHYYGCNRHSRRRFNIIVKEVNYIIIASIFIMFLLAEEKSTPKKPRISVVL